MQSERVLMVFFVQCEMGWAEPKKTVVILNVSEMNEWMKWHFNLSISEQNITHLYQVHVAVDAAGFTVHQVLQVLALVGVWSCMES